MTRSSLSSKDTNYVEAGKILKKWRLNSHFSQKMLGEKVDIDHSYISKIERGTVPHAPRETHLLKISEILYIPKQVIEQVIFLYRKVPSRYEEVYSTYYKLMPGLFKRLREDPGFANRIFSEARKADFTI